MSPTGGAPQAPNFDIWVANHILLYRVCTNAIAFELNAIPRSETRLRDEGVIPCYSFVRNIFNTLKSSAHERGATIPAVPDAPADWAEDVSTDYKALAAQLRPHMAEPAREVMNSTFGLRDRNPKPHWASLVAANSLTLDLFVRMAPAMGGIMRGSEWEPFIAQMTSSELKWIAGVIGEEILKIRAQPGSGWDEEEAKGLAKERLRNMGQMMKVGT